MPIPPPLSPSLPWTPTLPSADLRLPFRLDCGAVGATRRLLDGPLALPVAHNVPVCSVQGGAAGASVGVWSDGGGFGRGSDCDVPRAGWGSGAPAASPTQTARQTASHSWNH